MNKTQEVICHLNDQGIVVLEICDSFYYVAKFQEANQQTMYHTLEGVDITKEITKWAQLSNNLEISKNAVNEIIANGKMRKRYFHGNYLFILHLK